MMDRVTTTKLRASRKVWILHVPRRYARKLRTFLAEARNKQVLALNGAQKRFIDHLVAQAVQTWTNEN